MPPCFSIPLLPGLHRQAAPSPTLIYRSLPEWLRSLTMLRTWLLRASQVSRSHWGLWDRGNIIFITMYIDVLDMQILHSMCKICGSGSNAKRLRRVFLMISYSKPILLAQKIWCVSVSVYFGTLA